MSERRRDGRAWRCPQDR